VLSLATTPGDAVESSQECLQRAEQCERQAAEAKLESTRNALLAAAAMWRKLAASPPPIGEAHPIALPVGE
jgi:cellobiose-specific phosphotransferase system component IIA